MFICIVKFKHGGYGWVVIALDCKSSNLSIVTGSNPVNPYYL